MESNKCFIKSCTVNPALHDLFMAPEDPAMLKKWQELLQTTENDFYVCDNHFEKKFFERNLTEAAVPALHLSDEVIKLENDCCGLCLKVTRDKSKISCDLIELFKEICGYETLTDFICKPCHFGLTKYKQFQTVVRLKHAEIRNAARNVDTDDSDDSTAYDKTPNTIKYDSVPKNVPKPAKVHESKLCKICKSFIANNYEELFKHILNNHSFRCESCSFNCQSENVLKEHIMAEHATSKRSFKCEICNLSGFIDLSILNLHKQNIHDQNVFDCEECDSRFNNADNLRVHMVFKHHVQTIDPQQITTAVPSTNPQKQLLRQLPMIKHVVSLAPNENKLKPMVKVIQVGKVFPAKKKLEESVQTKVSRVKKKITPRRDELHDWTENSPIEIEKVTGESQEFIFNDTEHSSTSNDNKTEESEDEIEEEQPIDESTNNLTGRIFARNMPPISKSTLLNETPANKDHVKCLECHHSFKTILDLFNHRKEEHKIVIRKKYEEFPPEVKVKKPEKDKVACEFCFLRMFEKHLEKHIEDEHSNKPNTFLCHICSQTFSTQKNLTKHLYKHNRTRDYECDLCGQKFFKREKVKAHLEKSHLSIKRYKVQCKICEQKLVKTSKIISHMKNYHKDGYDCGARINSETNWFDCEKCGASYADLFTFRRHDCEKGRFQIRCPECMRPLKNQENLNKHLKNKCRSSGRNKYGAEVLFFSGYGGIS